MGRMPVWRYGIALLVFLIVIGLAPGQDEAAAGSPDQAAPEKAAATHTQEPAKAPAAQQPAAAPQAREYAGSVACELCHEEARAGALAFHAQLNSIKNLRWSGRACEACHGPAKAHTESANIQDVFSFKTASPKRVIETCLNCHSLGLRSGGRFFDMHTRENFSCVRCHAIHKPKAMPLLAEDPKVFCMGCHVNIGAEFVRPYRHKLQEGTMTCLDCHNPHGTPQRAQTHRFAGNDLACLKCHGDKRGPFIFEHAGVRLEGCAACHEAHGSVNPRMLRRAEVRFLCLECHTFSATTLGGTPPAFHDLRSPRFQNCTTCHVKIHGSNVSRAFLR